MLKRFNFLKLKSVEEFSQLPCTGNFTYNYLLGIAMLYITLSIISGLTVYKLIKVRSFLLPAGIFTTPLTYCLSNVTTEVYGFPVARNMLWWFIACSAVFTGLTFLLVHLPSPSTFEHQSAYNLILGSMPRIYIAGTIGTIVGIQFNNYIVSKFKIMMDGNHYWIRSLISTCGGEILYNIIAYPIMLLWEVPSSSLMHIFISVTIFKVLTTAIFLLPECLLARYLKIKEKINVFDYNVNYNLFNFKIRSDNYKPKLSAVK